MPYVGREANSFTTVVDVTVSDDLTVTDDATIGGALSAKGGAVFNEDSADVDFRVESNGNANMLFVDGGNDTVNIGSADQGAVRLGQNLNMVVTGDTFGGIALTTYSTTDSRRSLLDFNKSGQATIGSHGVVANDEVLGSIFFRGDDGDEFVDGAEIRASVDGTPGGNDMPTRLTFSTTADGANSATERMRIDSSGDVLIGKTSVDTTTDGLVLRERGQVYATSDGNTPVIVNRKSSNGNIVQFRKDNTTVGNIGSYLDLYLYIGSEGQTDTHINFVNGNVRPATATGAHLDDALSLGHGSSRWDDIHATNGTIQTSDENEKQDVASMTTAELAVGKRISALFKTYRWKTKVASKGDNARTHSGIVAQHVKTAFEAESLDAGNYGLFIIHTWWEQDVDVAAVKADDTVDPPIKAADAYTRTDIYDTEAEAPEGSTKKTRMGIRYPELLSFLASYNEARFTAIETRIKALEDA
jgi:prepilin-type processing-associated H-X9-DG protein